MQNARTTCMTIFLIIGLAEFENLCAEALKTNNTINSNAVRNPKIMYGVPTKEGEFKWQASLELLHPSFGFIGHWCGGVLIHKYWVLSAAHCVHNDLFNLPLPALWTIVLGEYNRKIESGLEQRIPVEKIVMHEKYHNFRNDLVLMKLSRPAIISSSSKVAQITLPLTNQRIIPSDYIDNDPILNPIQNNYDEDLFDRNENYLRKLSFKDNFNNLTKKIDAINAKETNFRKLDTTSAKTPLKKTKLKTNRRRNDKFLHHRQHSNDKFDKFRNDDYVLVSSSNDKPIRGISYIDCVATGWGKYTHSDHLSDVLLQTKVPIHSLKRCESVYNDFVRLNRNQHLCAGNLNGSSGACVGDSGGGMQCKTKRNGPWILVGITSFGSGCSMEGYPDVFTNVAYYKSWIDNVINNN